MASLPLSRIIGRVHAVQPSYTDQRIISLSAFSLFPSGNNQYSSANGAGCQISNQLVLCAPEQHRLATPGLCNILPLGTAPPLGAVLGGRIKPSQKRLLEKGSAAVGRTQLIEGGITGLHGQ